MIRITLKTICLPVIISIFIISLAVGAVPDNVSKQRHAVVRVNVNDRNGKRIDSGTGFVVDSGGVVVTNCQVIAKWITAAGTSLSVEMEGGSVFPVEEVISSKCANNLLLLRIKAKDLPTVKFARDYKPGKGEGAFFIASHQKSEAAISSVHTSARTRREDSGSPLLNIKGEVIGALIVQSQRGKNRVTTVSVKDILKQLDRYMKHRPVIEENFGRSETVRPPAVTKDDVHELFSSGCAYDQANMFREAIDAYRKIIKMNPNLTDVYVNLGVDYYKLGEYDKAVDMFKQALQIRPDLVSAYNKLGATYIVSGSYSMAINAFKKAIEIDPSNSSAHFNLGIAYFLSGDSVAASEECRVLKDIDKAKADSLSDLIY